MISKFLPKLWNKNKTKGIAINPENDTALAITKYSVRNIFWFLSRTWNNIKKNKDTNMTDTIFVNKFLNDLFSIKYSLKNSTGMNRTKSEINRVIKDQKRPCPLHLINACSTRPDDSKNK